MTYPLPWPSICWLAVHSTLLTTVKNKKHPQGFHVLLVSFSGL